jgi:hypothetical protein
MGGVGLTAAEKGARARERRWAAWAARGRGARARGRERVGRIQPSRGGEDFPFSFSISISISISICFFYFFYLLFLLNKYLAIYS